MLSRGVHPVTCLTNPARPELVEGLYFSACGAHDFKNKDSASTSSAWMGLGARVVHHG